MDKLITLGLVERLKNCDFILETKMTKLNQHKNSKQPNWANAVWKLCFTLEINEYRRIVVLKVQEDFRESCQVFFNLLMKN